MPSYAYSHSRMSAPSCVQYTAVPSAASPGWVPVVADCGVHVNESIVCGVSPGAVSRRAQLMRVGAPPLPQNSVQKRCLGPTTGPNGPLSWAPDPG
jgi:hypothetical protein